MFNPYADAERLANLQGALHKSQKTLRETKLRQWRYHLRVANAIGHAVPDHSKVLDIGCGVGDSVELLLELGYDAYGIDVLELWGKDFDKFWEERARPTGQHIKKLHVV